MTEHAEPGRWHLHRLRVRYQETDQMGVVFYANYVNWFEIGRTELIRHLGMPYKDIEPQGMLLPVVDLECSYAAPARYDEEVVVCTAIRQFSPLRVVFRSQVRRLEKDFDPPVIWEGEEPPGELLAKGGTRHVWVNAEWRPTRLDKTMPELYRLLKSAMESQGGREVRS